MSNITVTSSTDTPEAVLAAQGGAVEPKVEPAKQESAAEEIPAETLEASELQDETDESEGDEPKESADDKPKGNKLQKRMSKLTRQREDARKEADYWKQVALEKQAGTPQDKPEVEAKTDLSKRPAAENFDTHELYVEALADWKVEEKLSKRDAETKQNALKSEQQTKLRTFLDKREAFAKGRDDFFERMSDIEKIPMSITVNESLLESENGPELLYELAKDPEEYKRICSLPAIQAARELGKFEATLSKADAKPQESKLTKAPKPPAPIGSGKSTSTKPLEEMDYQEFKKARESGRTA